LKNQLHGHLALFPHLLLSCMCSMPNHQLASQSKVVLNNLGEHVENN
jgi:hypothetical protein